MTVQSAWAGPRGAVELFHSSVATRRRLTLGASAAVGDVARTSGPVDLAVVAPGADEVNRQWIQRSVALAASRMEPDALLWVVVPRCLRRSAERAVARSGLALAAGVVAVPNWHDAEHLVPVEPSALGDAAGRDLGLPPAVGGIVGHLARSRFGRALLRRSVPTCALLAASPNASELFRWIGALDGRGVSSIAIATTRRRDARVAVVFRYQRGVPAPDLVVKVALDEGGRDRLAREREALAHLRVAAVEAGAAVPQVRAPTVPWLLSTAALPGYSAAATLARQPGQLDRIASSALDWLTAWNRATASGVRATPKLLDSLVFDLVNYAVHAGLPLAGYRDQLHTLAARIEGSRIMVVAAHNDLTMANILDAADGIGVVDWEEAGRSCLPLTDLWYLLADGVARAQRVPHVEAVCRLTRDERSIAPLALAPGRLARALSIDPDEALLAFHVCWLGHACNELRRGETSGPFLDVLRAVAEGRVVWADHGQVTT